ncbi:MAG: DUF4905 domain-containing protein [Bacteroidia bacterium]|nr:DUF4905 domain-containing protein [Bacteroidia bacterium]
MKEIPFENKIWKIIPENQFNHIFIETRSPENRSVVYFRVSFSDFSIQKINITEDPDLYWTSLAGESNGVLILTHYGEKEIPLNIGLSAYNAETGVRLWSHPNLKLMEIQDDYLLAQDVSSAETPLSVHLQTGTVITRTDTTSRPHPPLPFYYPEPVLSQQPEFEAWSRKIETLFQQKPVAHIDFWTGNAYEIIHYYTKESHLSQFIAILHHQKPVVHECLYRQIHSMTYEPFFILKNLLITIKEGNILCVMKLESV